MTDGRNRSGPAPSNAAQRVAERGVRVYPVGVGRTGKPAADRAQGKGDDGIDEGILTEIAGITQGEYFQAATRPDLEQIYRNLHGRMVPTTVKTELTAEFAGAAALVMALAGGLSMSVAQAPSSPGSPCLQGAAATMCSPRPP